MYSILLSTWNKLKIKIKKIKKKKMVEKIIKLKQKEMKLVTAEELKP